MDCSRAKAVEDDAIFFACGSLLDFTSNPEGAK